MKPQLEAPPTAASGTVDVGAVDPSRYSRDVEPRSLATQRVPSTSRKEAVRDAALTLFAERGYRATTIDDIGRRLSMRGPSLYNHIVSKQQLLADIVADFIEGGLRAQVAVLSEGAEPQQQLRAVVDIHVRFHMRHPRESFVGNREIGSLDPPLATRIQALRDDYTDNLIGVIERGVAAGEFSVENPRVAGFAILQMGMGVPVWFRPGGPLNEDQVSRMLQDYSLRIVGAQTSQHAA